MDAISTSAVVLIDDYYPDLARMAVEIADKARVPVVADTWPTHENKDLVKKVTVLIAPRQFISEGGFGDDLDAALDAIHSDGPRTAVITLGDQGWVASDPSGRYRGAAFDIVASDTLGAGDVFHGAFAFALANHWDTPRCAEFAAAVAAIKCTHTGGWTGIPDLRDTLAFLRRHSRRDWPCEEPHC
jgi:sulfofructose kinase